MAVGHQRQPVEALGHLDEVASDPKSTTTFVRQFNIESHRPLSMSNTSNDIGDRDVAKPLPFSISREESS